MLSAAEENLNTLMLLTGISEDEASALLTYRVRIVAADHGVFPALATDIKRLLERTLIVVAPDKECDLELGVGIAPTNASGLSLTLTDKAMTIYPTEDGAPVSLRTQLAGITRKGCACYAAGFVLSRLLRDRLSRPSDRKFELHFATLGFPVDEITESLDLGDAVLAGSGGIANGFLWALEELRATGKLAIVDPKKVRPGNANRCLYFTDTDKGLKAKLLAERANLPGVEITFHGDTLHEYVTSRPDKRLPKLISTVDSRAVRRSFQGELPLAVFDASTTDVSEVVVHSHVQPTANACLSCIYPHIVDEDHRDKHIAENLGLTLKEVQARYIDKGIATKLTQNFPQLNQDALVGMAFDSLHKTLCGEGTLKAVGDQQAVAPFAFISNLAGILLALEMYRYQTNREDRNRSNYLFISPWKSPHNLSRRLRRRIPSCEFCANPDSLRALRAVWPDIKDWP